MKDSPHNKIYTSRFDRRDDQIRQATWRALCRNFLDRFISADNCVLDIGAGDGFFLRNISARRRIAVDIGAHVQSLKQHGIEVVQCEVPGFKDRLSEAPDRIFISNFLEHLPNKGAVMEVLAESFAALQPGGRIIILQPNLRYVGVRYWDYIDHCVALTDRSLAEGLLVAGFEIELMIPKFLPFTVKSTLGRALPLNLSSNIVSLYLNLPFLWRFFGAQAFVVARKPLFF